MFNYMRIHNFVPSDSTDDQPYSKTIRYSIDILRANDARILFKCIALII